MKEAYERSRDPKIELEIENTENLITDLKKKVKRFDKKQSISIKARSQNRSHMRSDQVSQVLTQEEKRAKGLIHIFKFYCR